MRFVTPISPIDQEIAAENPEKLQELIEIFDEEAWKYNVYPLYDDMIKRLGAQQDRLFGDQSEFIYFAPGAVRIAEKSSAPVKNRAHTIETRIDLQGDEEGVIVAVGGMTGGYTMFIKDHCLYYDYNFLDGVHYVLKSSPLPKGETDLKFNFIKTREFGGDGELYINGEKVDEIEMPQMHIATYSLAETFDIGRDTGTQVSNCTPASSNSVESSTGSSLRCQTKTRCRHGNCPRTITDQNILAVETEPNTFLEK